ncbi:Golgi integral membrane protein 4-like isoform X2 [Centruroides vittatus]|uniref:Golgi integral membrane protein 4-like isoform X2 n=1 Tax=Centruroides vittatus TaxID=120091 RepID=UPI00350F15BD
MLKNPEKLSPYDYQKIPLTGSVMRNSRLRIFLYVLLGAALCCVVYLLKTTHSRFKEIENSREKCLQQRDSLSAQLQVVYEHKNRLEKSLQQEKIDHKHTKEEQDRQKNELHVRMEREKNKQQQLHSEIADLKNNYALLEEEKKQLVGAMSAQLESLKQQKEEEINKIKGHINQLILEKEDLQKNVENQMWRVKQHTDELQLCRLQYEQLENKLKELTAQLQRRSFIGDNHNPGYIPLHQNNNKLKDNQYNDLQPHQALEQIKNHKNVDKSKNQQTNQVVKNDERKEKDEEMDKDTRRKDEQGVQPKLLQRPNIVSSVKTEGQSQALNVLPSPKEHGDKNIDNLEHENVDTRKKSINLDLKDNVLRPPNIAKPIDVHQNEEHLPQVQPPHSFDKAEMNHDINKWDKDPKNVADFDQYHMQNPANNNGIPHLPNIKDADVQNEKQAGPDDMQEHGVLIKPPLDNNQERKIGQDVEGLKRGPQMIDEKNGKHKQQEEDGDYAEDGDDDNADDQEGEPNNGDDQLMADEQAHHPNAFKDADFDDQENADVEDKNVVNQDKEEGVMVAPK